jgi:hypothetical protein
MDAFQGGYKCLGSKGCKQLKNKLLPFRPHCFAKVAFESGFFSF